MAGKLGDGAQADVSRRTLLTAAGALALAGLAAPAAARQAAQPYPMSEFFKPSLTAAVRLSPSGDHIAVLEQTGQGDSLNGYIEIVDSADPEGRRRRIELGALKVQALDWGNDRRLLVRVLTEHKTNARSVPGSNIPIPGQLLVSRRTLSVDIHGEAPVALFQDHPRLMRANYDLGRIVDLLRSDPDNVLMLAREEDGDLTLNRVNIVDGSSSQIERGNLGTVGWHTQNGAAVLRRDINSRGTLETLYARAPGARDWTFVRRNRLLDAPDFSWVGETERPGVVLVSARKDGEDLESIREMDLTTLALGEPMNPRPGRDVDYGLTDTAGHYLGAAYHGQRLEYAFTEPGLAAHHQALDRFFEGDCDVHLTDVDAARKRFIAFAVGPREPGAWYFYDREARSIVNIGNRRLMDYDRLGPCELLTVPTRDGKSIEAYLTAPPTGRRGPLIVMPHGGPEVRDTRGWDRQVQVLAAQGWWVLQPNFRGSGGYGLAFAREGWGRWGDLMQDDIEDAVAHAISARGLDGTRVGIMGTSYGGYAALMGAVRRPDLYKAAIGVCGVYDLPAMLEWEKRQDDNPGQPIFDFWTRRIGDPSADAARLQAASPRRRAAEIACPVLLVHGAEDPIVPVVESRRMRDALRGARKSVDFVEIEEAGHADWEDDQEAPLMERYVALFRRAFA